VVSVVCDGVVVGVVGGVVVGGSVVRVGVGTVVGVGSSVGVGLLGGCGSLDGGGGGGGTALRELVTLRVRLVESGAELGGGGSGSSGSTADGVLVAESVAESVWVMVMFGPALFCCWLPSAIAAMVANAVAITMPAPAQTTRRCGRVSGSSCSIRSIGVPLVQVC
jgi:hypothetical protein